MLAPYSRSAGVDPSDETLDATKAHVRDHLASIADSDDDPTTHAEDVNVYAVRNPDTGEVVVHGTLDAEPQAPYLRPDYDPDAEERPSWVAWTPADDDAKLDEIDAELNNMLGRLEP